MDSKLPLLAGACVAAGVGGAAALEILRRHSRVHTLDKEVNTHLLVGRLHNLLVMTIL